MSCPGLIILLILAGHVLSKELIIFLRLGEHVLFHEPLLAQDVSVKLLVVRDRLSLSLVVLDGRLLVFDMALSGPVPELFFLGLLDQVKTLFFLNRLLCFLSYIFTDI